MPDGPSHLSPGLVLVVAVSPLRDTFYTVKIRDIVRPEPGQGWICRTREGNDILVRGVDDAVADVVFLL